MSLAILACAQPAPVQRDVILPRSAWWRCLVGHAGAGQLYGAVVGDVLLGGTVVMRRVQLDDGTEMLAWPALIHPLPPPAPITPPALTCLPGGRA